MQLLSRTKLLHQHFVSVKHAFHKYTFTHVMYRLSSGTLSRNDLGTLPYFTSAVGQLPLIHLLILIVKFPQSYVKSASIMAASAVGAYVQANAGLGKVN